LLHVVGDLCSANGTSFQVWWQVGIESIKVSFANAGVSTGMRHNVSDIGQANTARFFFFDVHFF
jgi:hypothetical protein